MSVISVSFSASPSVTVSYPVPSDGDSLLIPSWSLTDYSSVFM